MTKTLIPAVGYARRSTDMQERSIPDQQAAVERWAAEHGYRVLRWYIDDAVSGTSARGRDAFEQMLKAAENGRDFETVLCYDISRFSRGGTNETGFYLHRLHLACVGVVFTADGIPEGDEGELIQGVKSWQTRQYSVKLARDTILGQISNIRERKSAPGGVSPYGYDKQHLTADGKLLRTLRWMPDGSKQEFGPDGKLLRVIEPGVNIKKAKSDIIRYVPSTPDRVAIVRCMFDLCVQGYGYHYIAALFNKEGIPSPGGLPWNTARVGKLIRNPVYRGALVYNKRTEGSLFGMSGTGTLRPKKGRRGSFQHRRGLGHRPRRPRAADLARDVRRRPGRDGEAEARGRQGPVGTADAGLDPAGVPTVRVELHHRPRRPGPSPSSAHRTATTPARATTATARRSAGWSTCPAQPSTGSCWTRCGRCCWATTPRSRRRSMRSSRRCWPRERRPSRRGATSVNSIS
jgi:DNA invertase Pin-like site-specific DNA recombinase